MDPFSEITPAPDWRLTDVALRHADIEADQLACFAVMHELRPHLRDSDEFLARIGRAASQGYRILAAWEQGKVVALAGYRFQENLVYGPFLYVDDLVSASTERGKRWGERLPLRWRMWRPRPVACVWCSIPAWPMRWRSASISARAC
jgi:hypothetical protein